MSVVATGLVYGRPESLNVGPFDESDGMSEGIERSTGGDVAVTAMSAACVIRLITPIVTSAVLDSI